MKLKQHYLFISDVHLQDDTCNTTAALFNFLQRDVPQAEGLFILGDFFDLWLGDDNQQPFKNTLEKLHQASLHTPIYFMRGNHDFLVGDALANSAGFTLLPDPYVMTLFNQRLLLTHGDLLCSQDQAYQRYRRIIQHPISKNGFRQLPLRWRQNIAQYLKSTSKEKTASKTPQQLDVNPDSIETWLKQHQAHHIIHGHTHRPGQHQYSNRSMRWVMGAWHDQANYLRWDQDQTMHAIPL